MRYGQLRKVGQTGQGPRADHLRCTLVPVFLRFSSANMPSPTTTPVGSSRASLIALSDLSPVTGWVAWPPQWRRVAFTKH